MNALALIVLTAQIHTAGDAAVQPPVLEKEIRPTYTPVAMHNRIEGTVGLQSTVDKKGRPRQIRVTRPLEPGLDRRAADAFAKWRFKPATKDGKPVEYRLDVSLTFDLRHGHRGPVYSLPDPDLTPPAVVKDVKPTFPVLPALRNAAIKLEGIVETDGAVSSVRILGTSHMELAVPGIEAFLASRFRPATRAGVPVACRVEMEYTFHVR